MVLVIVSVHDNCCSRLLIDWTLWEADSKWKVEGFFHKVYLLDFLNQTFCICLIQYSKLYSFSSNE